MQATATAGRIRFRHGALKVGEKATALRDSLLDAKGVLDVQINKRVGSALVLYDKAKLKLENVLNVIAEALGIDMEKVRAGVSRLSQKVNSRKGRRYVKRGMMGAGVTSLALLTFSETGHAVAGSVMLACAAVHLYQNRRTLMK